MPTLDFSLTGFVRGDDLAIEKEITSVPTSQTLAKAWLTIKEELKDLDASAVIQKSVTPTPSLAGEISDTGADGTGKVLFLLTGTDTLKFKAGRKYHLDIQVKTNQNMVYTPLKGTLIADEGVTQATS